MVYQYLWDGGPLLFFSTLFLFFSLCYVICSTFLDLSPCSDPLYINSPTTIVGTMLAESKKPYSSLKAGLSFLLCCYAASLLEFTNQDSSIFIVLFQSLYSYSIHAHFPLSSSRQQAPFLFFWRGSSNNNWCVCVCGISMCVVVNSSSAIILLSSLRNLYLCLMG